MKYLKYLFSLFTILTLTCISAIRPEMPKLRFSHVFAYESSKYHQGIDISHHQGHIEWNKIDTTIDFVICKSTEGSKFIDYKFEHNWKNIKGIKGCYHFFRPQISGKEQAKRYLSVINLEVGNIIPIVDVEMTPYWRIKKNRVKGVKNLLQFVSYIENETGEIPLIYTTGSFWNNYISPYYPDKDHLLWVADYRKKSEPKTPNDMDDWVIWQFTDRSKISGINTLVDKNICKDIKSIQIK